MRHRLHIALSAVAALTLLVGCAADCMPSEPPQEGTLPGYQSKPKKTTRPKKTTPIFTPGSGTIVVYPRPLSADDIEATHRGDNLHFAWAEELRGVTITVSNLLTGTRSQIAADDGEYEATVCGITESGIYEIVITSDCGTITGSFVVE